MSFAGVIYVIGQSSGLDRSRKLRLLAFSSSFLPAFLSFVLSFILLSFSLLRRLSMMENNIRDENRSDDPHRPEQAFSDVRVDLPLHLRLELTA